MASYAGPLYIVNIGPSFLSVAHTGNIFLPTCFPPLPMPSGSEGAAAVRPRARFAPSGGTVAVAAVVMASQRTAPFLRWVGSGLAGCMAWCMAWPVAVALDV